MLFWVAVLSLGASPPPPGRRYYLAEKDLVALCAPTNPDAAAAGLCLGYVVGVVDRVMFDEGRRIGTGPRVCPPTGLSANAAATAVIDGIRKRAAIGEGPAAGSVFVALRGAFPCPPR